MVCSPKQQIWNKRSHTIRHIPHTFLYLGIWVTISMAVLPRTKYLAFFSRFFCCPLPSFVLFCDMYALLLWIVESCFFWTFLLHILMARLSCLRSKFLLEYLCAHAARVHRSDRLHEPCVICVTSTKSLLDIFCVIVTWPKNASNDALLDGIYWNGMISKITDWMTKLTSACTT